MYSAFPHLRENPGLQVYMATLPARDSLTLPWNGADGAPQFIQNEEFSICNRIKGKENYCHIGWVTQWGGKRIHKQERGLKEKLKKVVYIGCRHQSHECCHEGKTLSTSLHCIIHNQIFQQS
jgi:hypothetical protein